MSRSFVVGNRRRRVVFAEVWPDAAIFFFKQKTAYDIGLGIPAEPLFRSYCRHGRFNTSITHAYSIVIGSKHITLRSEERRVGKECRSRWSAQDKERNASAIMFAGAALSKGADERDFRIVSMKLAETAAVH